jgi:thiol-disulfide isomerase/thioredoxin
MANNRQKLKTLFLFNGLLFLVALILIQYSVVSNPEAAEIEDITKAEFNNNLDRLSHLYADALDDPFETRLEIFDSPITIENATFKNVLDADMSLDDLKGQWVVLNFWASWCPPCIVEMPSFQELQDIYGGKGVKVVAIGLDRGMDGQMLRDIMRRFNFGPVAAYYGEWDVMKQKFDITTLPTTYILSPNGRAVAKLKGKADWANESAKGYIEILINQVTIN